MKPLHSRSAFSARWSITGLIAALFLLGLLIHRLILGHTGLLANRELRDRLQQMEREIEELRAENEVLRHEVKYRNSPDYLEELARTELRKVFPGETIILFPTPAPLKKTTESVDSRPESGDGSED